MKDEEGYSIVGKVILVMAVTLCLILVIFSTVVIWYAVTHPGTDLTAFVDMIVGGWSTLFGVVIGFVAGRSGRTDRDIDAQRRAASDERPEPP